MYRAPLAHAGGTAVRLAIESGALGMQSIKIEQYTGASLLNARQLNLSMRLMQGDFNHDVTKPRHLTLQQVMQLLNVLETLAMSSQVLFDGSIQPDDKEQLIKHNHHYRSLLKPTEFALEDEWLNCCQQAAAQSALLMKEWLQRPERWAQQPPVPDDDATKFARHLRDGLSQRFVERKALARQLLKDNNFRGAKCVAGLLLTIAEQAPVDQPDVGDVTEAFEQASAVGRKPELVAGLIDRFRVNFVNELAAQHSAVYVAAPAIEDLKAQQSALLWRYLGKQLHDDTKVHPLQQLSQHESEAMKSFPYGYALLMQKRVKTPGQLLDLLFKVRDESVIRQQASERHSGKRFVHEWSHEQFADVHAHLFGDTFRQISTYQTPWHERLLDVGRSCLPAILSIGSAGLGIVIPDSVLEGAAAMSVASAGVALEKSPLLQREQKAVKLYQDNYLRWRKLLSKAGEQRQNGNDLFARVEAIFGLPVVVDGV